jgi:cytochrome P450
VRTTLTDSDTWVGIDGIDLFDVQRYATGNQHVAWRTLRREAPVWRQPAADGTPIWSVTRYDDVLRVIKDHGSFSSEYGTILAVMGGDLAGGRTINLMDPPRHGAIRVPTMTLLSTRAMLDREESIRARVRAQVRPLRDGGRLDLAALLLPLPLMAVGDVIGIPEEYWTDIPRWTMAGVAPADPAFADGTVAETLQTAHHELFAMFHGLIRERRARPADDVISTLLAIRVDGRRLSLEEVVLNCYSFVMGANTTTPHAAAQMLLAFAERPELWERLRAEPERADTAVEEGLRWSTPTNHLMRRVARPVTIAGVPLDEGELVCAWVASANRDEERFADPYRFDDRRTPNPHLALGYGIHFCNGSPAARLVLRILLEELAPLVARFEVVGEVRHVASNFINGISSLPVRVELGAGALMDAA